MGATQILTEKRGVLKGWMQVSGADESFCGRWDGVGRATRGVFLGAMERYGLHCEEVQATFLA